VKTDSLPFMKVRSDFVCKGICCAGDLYMPSGLERPPVVVMAHGFAAERSFRLPAYAERFVNHGMAVYLFDYRCFGDSDGEPRNYVDPWRHLADWQSALAHVRSLSNVNTDRIALWGTSFSGGHVIVTAAEDKEISAIVAQVPHIDPITSLRKLGLRYLLHAIPHALRDVSRMTTFRSPHYVKVIGTMKEFACLNTPDSYSGYLSMIPLGSNWQNRCPARSLITFLVYRPMKSAAKVSCPALIMMAENDSLIESTAVEKMSARMPYGMLVKYPFGHFDIYNGQYFEDAVAKQIEFLVKHLRA
jgi:dienelactone hydrolase